MSRYLYILFVNGKIRAITHKVFIEQEFLTDGSFLYLRYNGSVSEKMKWFVDLQKREFYERVFNV